MVRLGKQQVGGISQPRGAVDHKGSLEGQPIDREHLGQIGQELRRIDFEQLRCGLKINGPFGPSEPIVAGPVHEAVKMVSENPADAEKLRQVAEQFGALKLHSVMLGRTPVAMINRSMVQVGSRMGDLTVVSIEADRVLLSYEKNVFELKLPGVGEKQ